jgi:PAS domain S-box-containing protein
MKLRNRFLLLGVALSLAPLLLVGLIAYSNGRRAIEDSLGRLFELKASQAIETLDREVASLQGTARAWAGLEWMQDVLSDDVDGRITTFLMQQTRAQKHLAGARVTNAAGAVIAASRPEWVGGVAEVAPTAEVCEDAVAGEGERGPRFTCRFPIRAAFDEEKIVGTLHVYWDPAGLFPREEGLPGQGSAPGELVLLRRDGVVVRAPQRWQGYLLTRNLVGSRVATLAASSRGYLLEVIAGEECLIGFDHSRGASGWSALVVQDVGEAFAPARRLGVLVLGVGTLLALIVTAASFLVARRVTDPLLEIEAAARRVAAGDLSVRLEPRSRDEMGSLAASFDLMVRDLRVQHAQSVDKEYLDSLLASMIDGLLVIDGEGRVERVNPSLLALVGREEADVMGGAAASLFAEGQEGLEAQVLEPARRSGAAREVEMHLLEKGGARIPVSLSAGLLPAAAAAEPSVVCIAADVRRRKAAEAALVHAREAAEASALAKDSFLATISHEIRTPLHGILGVVDLLEASSVAPTPSEHTERLRHSAEALLAVVNQILDFSKLDAGKVELERREFEPRACLEGVAELLAPQAREKDLELVSLVDAEVPTRVLGDPVRLRQVLLNLGTNAIKFTRRGEVVIRVSPGPRDSSLVRFSVADSGIGIPEPSRARLFQPFSQLDASSTRAQGGTGLGLAISRRLVELMGGQIGFESEEGKGSTFWFTAELPALAEPLSAPTAGVVGLAGLRVLVVDDNATNRFVAREMLRGWGASVSEASDAWEALEQLRTGRGTPQAFDLALIDFQMPEMDGGQLAAEIRRDPELATLPLVLLTSVPQHGDAVRMMKLGFDAYLTKPVRQSVLHDALGAVLGRRAGPSGRLALVVSGPGRESRPRVLVVDEDAVSQRQTREAFETAGCRADVASDGAEALQACAEAAYDVVLLAAAGPDAQEDARRIREHERARARSALVIVAKPPSRDDVLQILARRRPTST